MTNVEITFPGPSGNHLQVIGRTEHPLDRASRQIVHVDSIRSMGKEGEELALTLDDLLTVCVQAEFRIAEEEDKLIERFLDAQD